MSDIQKQRRRALARLLAAEKLDALVVSNRADIFYLTGFTGDSGAAIVTGNTAVLITDGRFTVQSKEECQGIAIHIHKVGLFTSIGELLKKERIRRAGFDAGQLTVAQLRAIKKSGGAGRRLLPVGGLVQGLRIRKDASELAQMRKAAILASEVVESAIRMLKPGVREFEIAAEIEYRMRKGGASGPAFESIVAFGERAALPHARPTAKRLRKNEFVVLDLGAILGHYCSDITRTVYVGKASKQEKSWYQAVLEAQAAAIRAVTAGASCGDVDAAARDVLQAKHLDQHFVHSTGHGLGLEVHEEPRVAKGQKAILQPGTVITIEPGIYLAGRGGIRIEDDVAVHEDRIEILTRAKRDFIEI